MNISYDSYRVFYYAAKYKSFSQAAAALYNDQPNVTRMIRRLESELRCPLFFRSPQGVRLTPEGEKLYTHIAAAFESIAAGEEELLCALPPAVLPCRGVCCGSLPGTAGSSPTSASA